MLKRIRQDERGFSMVFVAIGLIGFLACTTLAIDVGMFMTARAQAQNAADAGALAGATALAVQNYFDRSPSGPAVQNAMATALANQVMAGNVSVEPRDVTFPSDPAGQPNWIRVQVFRSRNRGNPVATLMGRFFGVRTANVTANATAEAAPANAVRHAAPFMIPDKWIERQDPFWDPQRSTFEMYDRSGNLLPNPDIYIPADQAGYTGYSPLRDIGTPLTIRAGTGNNIEPDMYFSWEVPGGIGADFYRQNIISGVDKVMDWGSPIVQEPGDMSGPTTQGIDDLIGMDLNAYWDTGCNCVKGSSYGISPRIISIPLYDPQYYAEGKRTGRVADFKVANWLGFFVVGRQGNNVLGRITPVIGIIDPNGGPAPAGAFPRAIRLVSNGIQ